MLKGRRFWVGLVVTLFFLALFFYQVDFAEMGRALQGANYLFLLPAIALYFLTMGFRTLRWRYLLDPLGHVSVRRLFPVMAIGYTANNTLPLRLGELVRVYFLGQREGLSKASALATIAVERIFDGLVLLLMLAAVSLYLPLAGWIGDTARIMAAFFIGALVSAFAIASSRKLTERMVATILRLVPGRARGKLLEISGLFLEGLRVLHRPDKLLLVFLTTCLVWLAEAGVFYLVGFSFNLDLPVEVWLLTTSTSSLAISLPSSQGGIGPFEFFCARTLALFGVSLATANAYAIVLHAVLLVPFSLLGFYYLWVEGLSLGEALGQPRRGGGAGSKSTGIPLERHGDH